MGRAISVELARSGNVVCAIYRANEAEAAATQEEISQLSDGSFALKADLSCEDEARRAVDEVGRRFGRIDILVNNAGIFDFCFFEDMSDEYFDKVMNANFKSQLHMIRACLPYMKARHYGRIVNASSISGRFADVGLIAYGASKAAIDMLTKIGSAEFAPYGITVNAYAPGIIATDMTAKMIEERGEVQVKQISMNRFGDGADVAHLVKYLTSPEAGYITGEIIGVDGGFFKVQNCERAHEYARAHAGE
jgi:3-oxoacyl-[acyl-carrier protein] reductase